METPADRKPAQGRDGAGVAATQVTTCQWRSQRTSRDNGCNLPVEALIVSVCTLHNPDPNKDLDRFNQTLCEKIGQEEADDGIPEINLAGVVFPTDADFDRRVFKKAVTFAEAHFAGESFFLGAQFVGEAHFEDTRFGGEATFVDAEFHGVASFWGTQFPGGAHFANAQFRKNAWFGNAQLGGWTSFLRAQFHGGADFGDTEFQSEAHFYGAQFRDGASFGGAEFRRNSSFDDAQFHGWNSFENAQFHGEASFGGAQFPIQSNGSGGVSFIRLAPKSARNLRLEGVDLSRVSFLRTDVSQVQFVGCTWAEKPIPLLWPLPMPRPRQPRTVIYDEAALDSAHGTDQVEGDRRLVAEVYRQLRLNFEASRQEVEAGHFYIGQMEMRRQDTTYPRLYTWMLGSYRVLATYGESYWRPPFFYFLFGTVFGLAYLWGGLQVGQTPVKYDPASFAWGQAAAFFQDYIRAYVQALTAGGLLGTNLFGGPMGASLDTTSWWVPAVRYVNMLLDTFLVGFFVIALRRHFHR